MNETLNRKANILSVIIIILAFIASACGFFFPDLYNDNDFVKSAWFTNDIITLTVILPLLITAILKSQTGSVYWGLIWIGLLGYVFYNYAFYLFGSAFNKLFLVYTGLFSISVFTLLYMLWNTKIKTIAIAFDHKSPIKLICIYLILMPVILVLVELSMILPFLVTGKIPETILVTGHPTGIVFALDFSIVIPAFLGAAVLLWKRSDWGYVLGLMMLVKGFTYGLVLCIGSIRLALSENYGKLDPLFPLYIVLTIGGLSGCIMLYRNRILES